MTISIHLGAHKTATTHLQQSLRRIEPDLLDADRMFLGPVNLRQPPLDLRAMLNDPAAHPRNSQLARDLLRGLRREHSAMILSDGLFLGGLGRERLLTAEGSFYQDGDRRLGHLLELLGTRDATLFLALRSPASFVTSVHAELVREGQKGRIEDYLGGFDLGRARWLPLVGRLLARLGRGRLIV